MAVDYVAVLNECINVRVRDALLDAFELLFEQDAQLLSINASEQAIAARIAAYLGPHFAEYHVDVEYNRMGDIPKEVTWNEKPELVYPDIIVHIREKRINILAIELKKTSNADARHDDIRKLGAYRRELGYKHALFVRLGVQKLAGRITEIEWVPPGP